MWPPGGDGVTGMHVHGVLRAVLSSGARLRRWENQRMLLSGVLTCDPRSDGGVPACQRDCARATNGSDAGGISSCIGSKPRDERVRYCSLP